MSEKLEPCPFCGGESVLKFGTFPESRRKWWYASCAVEDYDCFGVNVEQDEQGGTVCSYPKQEDAITAWNARPAEKAAREEVLEWVYNRIVHPEASITLGLFPTKLVEIRDYIRQAYQERFGHEQG